MFDTLVDTACGTEFTGEENGHPSVLDVETGIAPEAAIHDPYYKAVLDYKVYQNWPKWWRRLEEILKLDIGLAVETKKIANNFDVIWVCSELVGIPLAFLGVERPIITECHHLFQKYRRFLVRLFDLTEKWAGVGYVTDDDRERFISEFHIPAERLFRAIKAPLDRFEPGDMVVNGPIIALGIQKRDYTTLIAALERLPGCETLIFASSKYGEKLRGKVNDHIPDWVHFAGRVSMEELSLHYMQSRFVVLPITDTTHSSAGSTVALEASAAGKAIIATRTSGTPTFIVDGKTGILVPPFDTDAWCDAISLLWNNPDLAHEMGMAGRKFVEDKFDTRKIDRETRGVIERAYLETRKNQRSLAR